MTVGRAEETETPGRRIAGVAVAVEQVILGEGRIELLRPADLAGYVDREALLGVGEAPEPPYWMHLWPGAVALARRLSGGEVRPGECALEIGCGLALAGLAAARRGALVTAVDWKREPLIFAAASAAHNRLPLHVAQMDWARLATRRRFALLLGADVAYDTAAAAALAAALDAAAAPRARLFLADSVNTCRDGLLRRLAACGWKVRVEGVFEREEGRNVWVRIIAAQRDT